MPVESAAQNIANKALQTTQNVIDNPVSGTLDAILNNPYISKLIAVIVATIVGVMLIALSRIIANYIKRKVTESFVIQEGIHVQKVSAILGDVVFYAMTMVSLFISFHIVGIDIGLLLGGISIGVGFAFRETLSNMISGIMIFSTKEYQVGSIVEFKMFGHIFGVIEEINMKNVLIRGFDLRRVVVPNARFLKRPVKTYNAESVLKLDFTLPVSRKIPVVDALKLTQAHVNTHNFVIHKELTQVLLDEYDDDEYIFKVIFCFDPNMGYTPDMMKSLVQIGLLETYQSTLQKQVTQ